MAQLTDVSPRRPHRPNGKPDSVEYVESRKNRKSVRRLKLVRRIIFSAKNLKRYRKEARKNSTEVTVWRRLQSFLPCQLKYRTENLKA